MRKFDYRCTKCGEILTLDEHGLEGEFHSVNYVDEPTLVAEGAWHACGPLKRVWSTPTIAWPARNRGH